MTLVDNLLIVLVKIKCIINPQLFKYSHEKFVSSKLYEICEIWVQDIFKIIFNILVIEILFSSEATL